MKYLLLPLALLLFGFSSCFEAADVLQEEFGAQASIKKYEWFKDAYNTLEEKRQTILVYEGNLDNIEDQYENIPRREWDRIDRKQYNQWTLEISGLKASYNKVVKEYNAQSSKFNWSLYDTTLPQKVNTYIND